VSVLASFRTRFSARMAPRNGHQAPAIAAPICTEVVAAQREVKTLHANFSHRRILRRNVGRPLAASDAQCVQVLRLNKCGKSLRAIAEETNLGLNTVRTIIGRKNGTDRTSVKHMAKIDPDRTREKMWTAKRQQRDALPKRINELRKVGDDLIKEAKRGAR